MLKILRYTISDLLKNWVIILFTFFLVGTSFGFFMLEGQADKATVGLLNLLLLVVPMMTIVFSTIYYYNMYEFVLLMLSQPLKRRQIMGGIYGSLAIVFVMSLIIGVGVPLLFLNPSGTSAILFLISVLMALIFTAIALFAGVITRDKTKGMGLSLLIWAYFALIFDGIVLLLMYNFSDYPIKDFVLYITFLNPIDLSRIIVLMQTDAAALMGYSGAVFERFFTETQGLLVAFGMLLLWTVIPLGIAFRKFGRKDL